MSSPSAQPRTEPVVLQELAQKTWRRFVCLSPSFRGINGQSVARSGHGHVEQATLFLLVQHLVIVDSQGIGVAELTRKLDQRLFVGSRKRRRSRPQDENVLELEALGGMSR